VVGNGGSKQAIACLQQAGIEFVPLSLLSFDRSVHSLVPSYRILSPPEKATLLRAYSTRALDWPKIFLSDPQVVYLGARLGDILHNISDNIFRVVIDAPL
jgi:DNA-directed RNA polymerase subunit H (RpoH/RPB5)